MKNPTKFTMTQAQALPVPFVSLIQNRPATTSLDIAEHFGKPHKGVLASVRRLTQECPADFTGRNFLLSEYTDETGRTLPMYTIYFDGFILLVMGYTGKKALAMKLAYIEAFNAMREELERAAAPDSNPSPLPSSPDSPLTPDQQCTLQAIVRAKVEALPREQRGGLYPKTWSRFNNHFRLAKYCRLPQSRMSEAVAYLTQLDVTEGKQALPTATPGLSPAPAFHTELSRSIFPCLFMYATVLIKPQRSVDLHVPPFW